MNHERIRTSVGRLYAVLAVVVVAGTMQVLNVAAAKSSDPQTTAVLLVAAAWMPLHLLVAAWLRRR